MSVPYAWDELDRMLMLCHGQGYNLKVATDESLFHTRHHFSGQWTQAQIFGRENLLGTGTITAPDHSPLVITQGVYLIIQAQGLADPSHAD